MKFSIITATHNSSKTLQTAINSLREQEFKELEHIVIDGASNDGTLDIIKQNNDIISKNISEPDRGIYDALNKGIKLATGEIIGILHSDDFYADKYVLKSIQKAFEENDCDAVYGNLLYVKNNNVHKIVRKWNAGQYHRKKIKRGWMPPHPTLFIKKSVYEKYGSFDLSYSIASDYELMMRFLWKYNLKLFYIPKVLIIMRTGGKSNRFRNIYHKMKEDYHVIRTHHIGGIFVLIAKNLRKITQFI